MQFKSSVPLALLLGALAFHPGLGCASGPAAPLGPIPPAPPFPSATVSAPAASSVSSVKVPELVPASDGWLEQARAHYRLQIRPDSHAKSRLEAATQFLDSELDKVRKELGMSELAGNEMVVRLYDKEEPGGPSKFQAFARWSEDGLVTANFLFVPEFDDRTDLLRSLVPNELVKASIFTSLKRTPTDHMSAPNSALSWLMEGEGTLFHTGGWFHRDVDSWAKAFSEGGLQRHFETIFLSDYQKEWKFNRKITHTFNVVEFPLLGSFTRYLRDSYGVEKYRALTREVYQTGGDKAPEAFQKVYGKPLSVLESDYYLALGAKSVDPFPIDPKHLIQLIDIYANVLESSARALTVDNENVGAWGKRMGSTISVKPLLNQDFAAAETALLQAQEKVIQELEQAAKAVERGYGVKLSIPVQGKGKDRKLVSGSCVVKSVSPQGIGQKAGLRTDDEIHLLDQAIQQALVDAPKKPYQGMLRVTRNESRDPLYIYKPKPRRPGDLAIIGALGSDSSGIGALMGSDESCQPGSPGNNLCAAGLGALENAAAKPAARATGRARAH